MSDNQEAYDAKCPALEAHEADRQPTVEERLEARANCHHSLMTNDEARALARDALAKLREQAGEIEEFKDAARKLLEVLES